MIFKIFIGRMIGKIRKYKLKIGINPIELFGTNAIRILALIENFRYQLFSCAEELFTIIKRLGTKLRIFSDPIFWFIYTLKKNEINQL